MNIDKVQIDGSLPRNGVFKLTALEWADQFEYILFLFAVTEQMRQQTVVRVFARRWPSFSFFADRLNGKFEVKQLLINTSQLKGVAALPC